MQESHLRVSTRVMFTVEGHKNRLQTHCRVCLNKLGKVKHLCAANKCCSLLLGININVVTDSNNIHSQYVCKICYSKMLKVSAGSVSCTLHPFPFTEHIEECAMCTYVHFKEKGGRPKKHKFEKHTHEHILSCAGPKVAPKSFSLATTKFYSPANSVSLTEMQCPYCHCIVDEPVEMPCRAPVCMKCILWLVQTDGTANCPSCHQEHDPLLIKPVSSLFQTLLLKLLLECVCKKTVVLENLRSHVQSGCKDFVIDPPSSVSYSTYSPSQYINPQHHWKERLQVTCSEK